MKWILKIVAVTGICFAPVDASAGSDKLLEFLVEGETHQGKVEALGENDCWLLGRDGRMIRLRLNDVKSFRRVEPKFRPYPAAEMRDRLQREFGKEYEVVGSGRYLVCAPRGRAKRYVNYSTTFTERFASTLAHVGFSCRSPSFQWWPSFYAIVRVFMPTRRLTACRFVGNCWVIIIPSRIVWHCSSRER